MKEEWRAVVGWEGLYEVSNLGTVRSVVRTGITSYGERKYGGYVVRPIYKKQTKYFAVNLTCKGRRKQRHVHVLVLDAFVGDRPHGYHACHINGDSTKNDLKNLRWGTVKSNIQDKISHGTRVFGEKSKHAKLAWPDVVYIRNSDLPTTTLANKFKVCKSTINKIKCFKTWVKNEWLCGIAKQLREEKSDQD